MIYRTMALDSLARILGTLEDPRDERGKRHRLIDILILAVIGTLMGHTDFTNMCNELRYHEAYYIKMLGLLNGIPSHDTFSAVFSIIDPVVFLESFVLWLGELATASGYHIAIDGKAVRAACDKVHNGKMPYLVNVFVVEMGLCIGQIRVDDKTNEIKGIPEMLKWLDLEGATVTIDAIGCQREIAGMIIAKGGNFVLPAKGNQPTLYEDIKLELETQIQDKQNAIDSAVRRSKQTSRVIEPTLNPAFDEFAQVEKGHGRIERRNYFLLNDPSCVDLNLWPDVKSIGMVYRERLIIHRDEQGNIVKEEFSNEHEAYILSFQTTAEQFAAYARGHWGIENSLHWVLDDYFREDRCTARIGHATENLGLLRKIAFDLMALDPATEKMSKKAKQVYYRNNLNAGLRLLFDYVPHRPIAD